jgi:hypothetical protein
MIESDYTIEITFEIMKGNPTENLEDPFKSENRREVNEIRT